MTSVIVPIGPSSGEHHLQLDGSPVLCEDVLFLPRKSPSNLTYDPPSPQINLDHMIGALLSLEVNLCSSLLIGP